MSDKNEGKTTYGLYCKLMAYVKKCTEKRHTLHLISVVRGDAEWEVFSVRFDEEGSSIVAWEDYLMGSAPMNVLETVKRLVVDVLNYNTVKISKSNLMMYTGYFKQMDVYIRGFYVTAVVRSYAIGSNFIPKIMYGKYSHIVLETIRNGCCSIYRTLSW